MNTKLYLKGQVKAEEGSGRFAVIASTDTIDRQGESIDQGGWDLANYKANPIILWAHDYSSLPIGVAEDIEINEQGLTMSGRFATAEANPLADNVRKLYEDGILKTVSVGFIPHERNGNVITKAELLEVSFVPVPANPQALSLAMTKGLKVEPALVELIEKCAQEDVTIPKEDDTEQKPDVPMEPEDTEGSQVQSVILSKEYFETEDSAKSWCTEHEYSISGMEETETSWRFRQFNPENCEEGSIRTINITEGVDATICMAKDGKSCTIVEGEEKSGRVLSQKNRDLISGSIQSMRTSIASLEKLLQATEPAERHGNVDTSVAKEDQVKRSESKGGIIEISEETLKELLSHSRSAEKKNELTNAVLKRLLKK